MSENQDPKSSVVFHDITAIVFILAGAVAIVFDLMDSEPTRAVTYYRLGFALVAILPSVAHILYVRGHIDGFREGNLAATDILLPRLGTVNERLAAVLTENSNLLVENGRLRSELRREIAAETEPNGEHPDQATLTALSNGPHGRGRGGIGNYGSLG